MNNARPSCKDERAVDRNYGERVGGAPADGLRAVAGRRLRLLLDSDTTT